MNESSGSLPELGVFLDLPLKLSAELASCARSTEDVLRLTTGSVVALNKITSGPVLLYANRKLVARGEAVVTGTNLGVKVTEINTRPAETGDAN
jgi:flagellar motor switch protein FliN/FliY